MIPKGFLSTLGTGFLARLYREIICSDNSFCFIAIDRGRIVGFACATKNTRALYRNFFKKNFLLLALLTIKKLFIFSNLMKIIDHAKYNSKKGNLPKAELLSIAILPNYKRKKIGRKLCEEINKEFLKSKIKEYIAVTAGDNPESNPFFLNIGYKKITGIRIHNDRESNIYLLRIK